MRFRKNARLDPSQIEDYRGASGGSRRPGGVPITLGGGGLIGVLVLVAFLLLSGGGGGVGDLGALAGQTVGPGTASTDLQTECRTGADANERDDCRTVAVVNSVQSYWAKTVRNYEPARTRFFTDSIQTGCGAATSASGPFYCPSDRYIYIDLGFFEDLQSQLGARGGPLAEAYVLAHEYGHYKAFTHQHLDEITMTLGIKPVLIPLRGSFTRGILSASVLRTDLDASEVRALFVRRYADQPFTHIVDDLPDVKRVVNTNKCLIGIEKSGDHLLVVSVIDNLLKGASGQAVQNMNIACGFDEVSGLDLKSSVY